MNKAEFIDALSDRFDGNRRQAQHALDQVIDVIKREVTAGERVVLTGFGVFEKIDRQARTARNPQTGATVRVKKTSVPKFKPGAEFKAVVSGAKKLPRVAASTARSAATTAKKAVPTAKKAAPAKKTTAKKTTAKKAPAKKAPAKKTTTRKTTAKKATTRKTAAKKSTARSR